MTVNINININIRLVDSILLTLSPVVTLMVALLFFSKMSVDTADWREGRNASDRGSARVMEVNTATARRKLRSHEGSGQRGALEQWR